jgi:hypothetical protein
VYVPVPVTLEGAVSQYCEAMLASDCSSQSTFSGRVSYYLDFVLENVRYNAEHDEGDYAEHHSCLARLSECVVDEGCEYEYFYRAAAADCGQID